MIDAWFLAGWTVCSIVHVGTVYAYFQRRYAHDAGRNRSVDVFFAVICGLMGPCGMFGALVAGTLVSNDPMAWYRYGWLFPGSKP